MREILTKRNGSPWTAGNLRSLIRVVLPLARSLWISGVPPHCSLSQFRTQYSLALRVKEVRRDMDVDRGTESSRPVVKGDPTFERYSRLEVADLSMKR
jgi:hypothetical protein